MWKASNGKKVKNFERKLYILTQLDVLTDNNRFFIFIKNVKFTHMYMFNSNQFMKWQKKKVTEQGQRDQITNQI